jgi:8-amino-7-oxononanoate synthase
MLDFTSSCYLGIDHRSTKLKPWARLTTGQPAALCEPKAYRQVAQKIADLQGMETGAIAKSTLHLFWDLFGLLGKEDFVAFVDAEAYPIAQWGLERFSSFGKKVVRFRHHHPSHLQKAIKAHLPVGERPLIVTDGWCTHCGKMAPLEAYANFARACGGLLVVDDTQALGIWGEMPDAEQPYGLGGGGSLRYLQLSGPEIILVASLAKGFGVPVAAISGQEAAIRRFCDMSETRIHCSPPSYADIYAAEHALGVNEQEGDRLRQKLITLVRRFKYNCRELRITTMGNYFPLQKLCLSAVMARKISYVILTEAGVNAIPLETKARAEHPAFAFALNATQTLLQIDKAASILQSVLLGEL